MSAAYDAAPNAVFGVSESEVRSLADDRITIDAQFPNPVPRNQVLFADCDLVFNAARPLRGSGIIYVRGNVTIASSSNTFFTGFIYLTGNLTMGAPSSINGLVMAGSAATRLIVCEPGPGMSKRMTSSSGVELAMTIASLNETRSSSGSVMSADVVTMSVASITIGKLGTGTSVLHASYTSTLNVLFAVSGPVS